MAVGLLAFLLTPLLYGLWGIDSDLPGLIILFVGLAISLIGVIRRKRLRGWRRVILEALVGVLLLPLLSLIVSVIYYLVAGKELGS